MEKGTKTRSTIIGCLKSIRDTMKSLLKNDENENNINDIKDINEYKLGELSEEDQKLIESLKAQERKLKMQYERAKSSIQKQMESGTRTTNLRMQIIENENEK